MVVYPNAKINLGLHILRRRADGYHDVDTLMLPVDWTDTLEVVSSAAGADSLETTGFAIDCPTEKNLVMKAVRELRKIAEFPSVAVRLHKVIPDGAGLGGGSSDAAFTLKSINALFSLGLSDGDLVALAANIGADCPFFIYDKPAICTGTGTEMTLCNSPLPKDTWMVISKPDAFVSTKEAYSGVVPQERVMSLIDMIESTEPHKWNRVVSNDFEKFVIEKHMAIAAEKELISSAGAWYVSMSGSGAAVYGFFDGRPEIEETPMRRVCQLRLN